MPFCAADVRRVTQVRAAVLVRRICPVLCVSRLALRPRRAATIARYDSWRGAPRNVASQARNACGKTTTPSRPETR